MVNYRKFFKELALPNNFNSLENYNNQEEFFKDLSKIKYCDLKSEKTSIKKAVQFCSKIMNCFLRAENILPDKQILEAILIKIGACEYKEAHKKFITNKGSMGEISGLENNIQFPLAAFNQIINNKSQSSYEYGWGKMLDGGKNYSWVANWLKTQRNAKMKGTDR